MEEAKIKSEEALQNENEAAIKNQLETLKLSHWASQRSKIIKDPILKIEVPVLEDQSH